MIRLGKNTSSPCSLTAEILEKGKLRKEGGREERVK